ncbi:hypothetical protein ALP91_103426, partial [Pseudomonas savastanoi pv. glycinea]
PTLTRKVHRYFYKIEIFIKIIWINQKSDADSDFSQNFLIFGNFVHACCFMTHMITPPPAENEGDSIKGNKARDLGGLVWQTAY